MNNHKIMKTLTGHAKSMDKGGTSTQDGLQPRTKWRKQKFYCSKIMEQN